MTRPAGNKNIFTSTPHLTGLMNARGVSWKNYQEDYQYFRERGTVTTSGTLPGGATNPYNGSTQYSYAAKHDPMAFFTDTASSNLYPISQLWGGPTGIRLVIQLDHAGPVQRHAHRA